MCCTNLSPPKNTTWPTLHRKVWMLKNRHTRFLSWPVVIWGEHEILIVLFGSFFARKPDLGLQLLKNNILILIPLWACTSSLVSCLEYSVLAAFQGAVGNSLSKGELNLWKRCHAVRNMFEKVSRQQEKLFRCWKIFYNFIKFFFTKKYHIVSY